MAVGTVVFFLRRIENDLLARNSCCRLKLNFQAKQKNEADPMNSTLRLRGKFLYSIVKIGEEFL